MQLLPVALERIAASEFKPEHIVSVLKTLELALRHNPVPVAEITLNYQSDEDQVTQDDLIPVITFSLRPARIPNEKMVQENAAQSETYLPTIKG
jgi:hypothetical protein